MSNTPPQEMFIALLRIGLSEQAAYYCLKKHRNELEKIAIETEEDIEEFKINLLKKRFYEYLAKYNETNQEDR